VPKLIPESFVRFLPVALAAVTNVATAVFVAHHQPEYPGRFIVFQNVMVLAALLAAVSNKWVWVVGFSLLLAGVWITGMSVGMFYLPTFFAALWVRVRD
jgi:hypothetical protein